MDYENAEITAKHSTTLADHIADQEMMLLFGKLIADLQPAPNGDRFARIVGTMRDHLCHRLAAPVVLALPEPEGPAAACDWDPQEYLMWRVPSTYRSVAMQVQPAPLHQLFATPNLAGARLSRGQALTVLSKSIRRVTHSSRQLDPADTLQLYGVMSNQVISQLRSTITGDPNNGVAQFGFSLDGNALALMSSSSTVDQVATTIGEAAVHNA